MQRISQPEILDSEHCSPVDAQASLRDIDRINRWFGGVSTTTALIDNVSARTGQLHLSLLEVAAGTGDLPRNAARQLAARGISVEVSLSDRAHSHLPGGRSVVADASLLPFADNSFDLVHCSLFAHHLEPPEMTRFAKEALRVSRIALLINDLVRSPLHLALVYAGFPLMRSHVSRRDGVASVKKAYVPEEMTEMLRNGSGFESEISRHYLFRMGVTVWKRTLLPHQSGTGNRRN